MSSRPDGKFWRVPLDSSEIQRLRGNVHVLEERCKGCIFCVDFCPRGVLARSERFNAKGYHPPDIVEPESCTGCHLCELLCPEFAIGVEEVTYTEQSDAR